jgi:hypothetical protein
MAADDATFSGVRALEVQDQDDADVTIPGERQPQAKPRPCANEQGVTNHTIELLSLDKDDEDNQDTGLMPKYRTTVDSRVAVEHCALVAAHEERLMQTDMSSQLSQIDFTLVFDCLLPPNLRCFEVLNLNALTD